MLTSMILSRAGEICGGGDFPPPSSSLPNTLAVQGVCLKIRFFPKAFLQGKSSECYYFAAISPIFSNINISVAKSTGFLIAIALILQFSPGVILSPHPGDGKCLGTFWLAQLAVSGQRSVTGF